MFLIAVMFSQEKKEGWSTQAVRSGEVFGMESWLPNIVPWATDTEKAVTARVVIITKRPRRTMLPES